MHSFLISARNHLKHTKGFTIIELLIVIAVVGILAAAVLFVINPLGKIQKTQDAKRLHDLQEIKAALSLYYYDNSFYPPDTTDALYEDEKFLHYLPSGIPSDPATDKFYTYLHEESDRPQWAVIGGRLVNPSNNTAICALSCNPLIACQILGTPLASKTCNDLALANDLPVTPTPTPTPPSGEPTATPTPLPGDKNVLAKGTRLGPWPKIEGIMAWQAKSYSSTSLNPKVIPLRQYIFEWEVKNIGFSKVRFMDVMDMDMPNLGPLIDKMYALKVTDIILELDDLTVTEITGRPSYVQDDLLQETRPDGLNGYYFSDCYSGVLGKRNKDDNGNNYLKYENKAKTMIDTLWNYYHINNLTRLNDIKFEIMNEYGQPNAGCVVQDLYNLFMEYPQEKGYTGFNPKIVLPAAIRAPLDSPIPDPDVELYTRADVLHQTLFSLSLDKKVMPSGGIEDPQHKAYGLSAHFYMRGENPGKLFAYDTWLGNLQGALTYGGNRFTNGGTWYTFDPYDFTSLFPHTYITEFGLNGGHTDEDLKNSLNAAWLASRLGSTSFYSSPTKDIDFFLSAAYGQPFYTDQGGGWIGLMDGFSYTRAHYPLLRQLELEQNFRGSTLYKIENFPTNLPDCNADLGLLSPYHHFSCLGGVTDDRNRWLLWNIADKNTQVKPVTVNVPFTPGTKVYVGTIDETHGNSNNVLYKILAESTDLCPSGTCTCPSETECPFTKNIPTEPKKNDTTCDLDKRSNPFNNPTTGVLLDPITVPTTRYIAVTIPVNGVIFLGDSASANAFQQTECTPITDPSWF